ncbi:MAG: glutamate--tRNA ligase [Methanophagales archaeon]|nr:glutamate--tRNA ligase [Methanophagales archaeon]
MEVIKTEIRKYALQNAVRYEQPPKEDAVLKKILAEHPELRKDAKHVLILVKEVIKSIESMSREEQGKELNRIAPELVAELKEKEKREGRLPELPLAEGEKVVMRFAPNPNGAATLGSARGIIVNSEYAKMYDGKFILRFDDTDPVVKRPMLEAYDWYLEDCAWLDAEPDEVVVASERMDLYYEYAEDLIKKGAAYVCFCHADVFKTYKEQKIPCPHRTVSDVENMERWKKMLKGVYEEKEAVLRIKTDVTSDDPALRDWVAFRILKREHPRVGRKYVAWPTLDFESAIEDHLLGITHIIRGKDLMKSEKRQRFLYHHLGWKYPKTMLWGKIKMQEFGKFSTSELRKRIERGEYEGWDDPRLPTLKALRRRGFLPEAIRKFFISIGVTQTDIAVSMKNLYAENRKTVDAIASRYFFVRNPKELRLRDGRFFVAKALKHPSREEYREIRTSNMVYISGDDFAKLNEGQRIRLKFLSDVEIESIEPLVGKAVETPAEDVPIIQWAPSEGIKVVVKKPEGIDKGIGEPLIASELGNVVQFERYGFVRIDSVVEKEVVAYFTH